MLIMGGEIYNKIILASASPRRSELLARAGIPFEVRVSDAAEDTYTVTVQKNQNRFFRAVVK